MSLLPSPPSPLAAVFVDALIGLPVLGLLLVVAMPSPRDALMLLMMSVICTLGIGGLLWLAMAVLIGRTLRLLWRLFRAARFGATRRPSSAGSTDAATAAVLSRYVEASLGQGADPQRLRRDLLGQGWTASQLAALPLPTDAPLQGGGGR